MKILFLVPDGVGIRNYLYSNLTKELASKGFEIQLYHKISQAAIKEIENACPNIISNTKELPVLKENFQLRLLRESSAYARLLNFSKVLNNQSIKYFWGKKPKTLKLKVFYIFCKFFGRIISLNYAIIRKAEKRYEKLTKSTSAYKKSIQDLHELKPDYVVNLHQRSPITTPILLAAKDLNVKNSTVIFSWDNVPKGRLICRPQTYFVWSDLMKNQMNLLYKEINPENIFVVGSPQFEFYKREEFKLTKEQFFKEHNLDIYKKTICFSGDDIMSSPYDQIFLNDLCKSLLKFKKENMPQIIFRRCPVDFSPRFDKILDKYKHLITVINPDWRVEKESDKNSFSLVYPSFNDLKLLVNTCLHSDLVINLGSTMAHDFAVYNKPCLYLNYNPKKDKVWSVEKIYKFEHFKSMKDIEAVGWVNKKSDFFPLISKALSNPNSLGKDRKVWLKKIVKHPLENNSKLLANKIIEQCISAS